MPEELSGAAEKRENIKITHVAVLKRGSEGLWVNKQPLTAVDGQVDVAVLRSQDVGGGAAVQAGRLRGHVDNLDGA